MPSRFDKVRSRLPRSIASVAAALLATAAQAQTAASTDDWQAIATDDLHYVRAILRANHPGPADRSNAAFREWYERGFDAALERAARARDYAGYFFALQYYLNGFQDGHLGALERDARLSYRWPGFTLGYRSGGFVVMETERGGPPPGDRLLECDGRPAEAWAEQIIRDYVGVWSVRGARPRYAPYLLVDAGNPFVALPLECRFQGAGGVATYALDWRAIRFEELGAKIAVARQHFEPPFEVRRFGAGGYWISIPSFDAGAPETVAALARVIGEITAQVDAIRAAPLLVIDVRGNQGGDSTYGLRVAGAIWGDACVAAIAPRPEGIDWRVSNENIRALNYFLKRAGEQFGADSAAVRELAQVVSGMEAAAAQGAIYYRETGAALPAPAASAWVRARTYFLTDYVCFSACLDFADLMRHIDGVVHVGQETSADAVYIDNNAVRLPSGNGWLGYSMKVHRGRVRGNNESYLPHVQWTGDMADTAALEAWIAELAAGDQKEPSSLASTSRAARKSAVSPPSPKSR